AVGRFVLMFMPDPTEALRSFAERIRPGGILAFCEQAATAMATCSRNQPALTALLALFTSVFERSGARPDIGVELYSRMREAGLRPDPRPLAEVVLSPAHDTLTYRRWALFARSMLPKIVEYGLGTEEEIRHSVEHDLREELLAATGLVPVSWLMIGQWARVPEHRLHHNCGHANSHRAMHPHCQRPGRTESGPARWPATHNPGAGAGHERGGNARLMLAAESRHCE